MHVLEEHKELHTLVNLRPNWNVGTALRFHPDRSSDICKNTRLRNRPPNHAISGGTHFLSRVQGPSQ